MNSSYQYVRELGRGSFGCVILAVDTASGSSVAVKKISRKQVQEYTESELLNHSMLRHPHIVKFHKVFLSPSNLNIVMEYVPDGSLLSHLQQNKSLDEGQSRWLFQQLIFAVDYCHKRGIANRDIKLDNILLDKSVSGKPGLPILKVTDFGYAKADYRSLPTSKVGTTAYMAPEVLHNPAGTHYCGKMADIWSCGVVLYAMLVGGLPFKAPRATDNVVNAVVDMLSDMRAQRYHMPAHLSPALQDLLRRMLLPDPQARTTMAEIMWHPWFMEGLPVEAAAMNDNYLRLPRNCQQSEEEIKAIALKAAQPNEQGCGYHAVLSPVAGLARLGLA